jgi:L-ascorbate metabolism protein UlaG (beta-lactamase superfamily)
MNGNINFAQIFVLAIVCVGLSCSKDISRRNFPAKDIIPSVSTHTLKIYGDRTPVRVLYLGCGHLAIQHDQEIVLIDPFFSTQGFTQTKIGSSVAAFKKYQDILKSHGMDLSETKSVWLAHTHYDHMMDLPLMLQDDLLPKEATIYGNEYGDDILNHFLGDHHYHTLTLNEVYHPENDTVSGKWFETTSSRIRVMPILSDHAPHYKVGPFPIHLMKGELNPDYFNENLKKAFDITKRNRWKEGTTYSFLVDVMRKDKVGFRLFIQTSGSHYPLGRPPAEALKERAVDVAFLCVASANYVKPYPVDILDTLKPKKTVFIHWEDFFRAPLDFEGARFVRLTNFRKLNRRMKRKGFELNKEEYVMPRPGTLLNIE